MSLELIATDVDGTILPRGGRISERTKAVVRTCEARNIPFVVTTGRWYVAAKTITDVLGQKDGYIIISGGGAVVRMDGTVLKSWTLKDDDARRIYERAKRENVMINSFVGDAVYRVNTAAIRRPVKGLGDYLGGRYHMVNDDPELFEEKGFCSPYKLEMYGEDREVLHALARDMEAMGYAVASAYGNSMEVMTAGAGKGTALRWLTDHLGIRRENCMAFGDNTNDISLLEAVGWPVAVGGAVDELKKIARIIAPDCADDGASLVMERALKGEWL